jgi:VWFA-related protein
MTIHRKHSFHLLLVTTLACSILVFASPQDKDKDNDKEDNSPVKFTVRTELVLIPTVVSDKSGNHITGLKKEDFTVLENGAERQIATFEEVHSEPRPLLRPSNPNEFSNFVAGEPSTSRITLIVLDFINTPFMAQAAGRQELLKYLTQSVDAREPTALYTLTRNGLQVIHNFTTDPRILAAALHKAKGDAYEMVDSPEDVEAITGTASPDGTTGAPSAAASGSKMSGQAGVQSEAARIQAMMGDAELNFQSFEQRFAITYTLDGLQQIAQALAGYPGRKSVIWASGGFPFNVSDTMQLAPAGRDSLADVLPMYEHTWQLLNDAQISLYPVDVKGLQVATMPSASVRNPGKNFGRKAEWKQLDTQATLLTFASMTGGRAYFNSNDLVKGFHDAVSDSSQYYMLGYYLDHSDTKPGWRKLAVKVKRDHIEVRARNGFFVTNATVNPENTRKADVSTALLSPLDCTSLALVAKWGKIEAANSSGQKHVNYEIHLSPDADVINEPDNNHLALDIIALAFTSEGKHPWQPVGQKVDVHVTPEKLAAIRKQGLIYRDALDIAPGEYTVRFVVRDDLTGRIGSVAAPLKLE